MQPNSEVNEIASGTASVGPAKPEWSAPTASFHGIEVTRNGVAGGGVDGVGGFCAS